MAKNWLDWTALVLVIIGAVNWGLVAVNSEWNIVAKIFGADNIIARIIYGLVGLSGLYTIYYLFK